MPADVVLRVHGGLGNQLFQYAGGLAVLRAVGGADLELVDGDGHNGTDSGLTRFTGLTLRSPNACDWARWATPPPSAGALRKAGYAAAARAHRTLGPRLVVSQPSPFSRMPVFPAGRPVALHGWFQDPSWFEDTWREAARLLLARRPSRFDQVAAQPSTVVHLRRGDYVGLGWVLPMQYYACALEMALKDGAGRDVVVVTDDPGFVDWFARLAQPLGFDVRRSTDVTGDAVVDDFWTIASGARIVLSNSTFSWWAAAAATLIEPRTKVWYPDPWLQWPTGGQPRLGMSGWSRVDVRFADQ